METGLKQEPKINPFSGQDDTALVREAKAGSYPAFEELVNRYESRIYSLGMRMLGNKADAEDVLQETFLAAFEKLKGFREEAAFSTWLIRIATNAALMKLRKDRGLKLTSLDEEIELDQERIKREVTDWTRNPARLQEITESREVLERAIAKLPETYRIVFLLRDVEGFTNQEVAKALKLSLPAVKSRLLRARLFLRGELNEFFKGN